MSCCYYSERRPNCTATRNLQFNDLKKFKVKNCVELHVEKKEPFIYHPTFQCNDLTSLCPKEISIFTRNFLLSFCRSSYYELFQSKYILEFIKIDTIWKLRFHLDVCKWIDYWLNQKNDDIISIAKEYFQFLQTIAKEENDKLSNFPDRVVYPVPLQHQKHRHCDCGQYLTSLRIPTVESRMPNFAVVAPSKAISEIIIMPIPGEVTHISNADLIKCSEFWKELFIIIGSFNEICKCNDSLGNYISFNFGSRESENLTHLKVKPNQQSFSYSTEHAHAHIGLSSTVINKISTSTFTYNDITKLKNCTRNPQLDSIISDRKNIADYLLFLETNKI